jgi:hypothetical protein
MGKSKYDTGLWKIEIRKLSELKPNPDNPRTITKDSIAGLRESMARNDYNDKIIVDENGMILSGHARFAVFSEDESPDTEIEVMCPTRKLTAAQKRDVLIGQNKTGGSWDLDALQEKWTLEELEPFHLGDLLATFEPQEEEDPDIANDSEHGIFIKAKDKYEANEIADKIKSKFGNDLEIKIK